MGACRGLTAQQTFGSEAKIDSRVDCEKDLRLGIRPREGNKAVQRLKV